MEPRSRHLVATGVWVPLTRHLTIAVLMEVWRRGHAPPSARVRPTTSNTRWSCAPRTTGVRARRSAATTPATASTCACRPLDHLANISRLLETYILLGTGSDALREVGGGMRESTYSHNSHNLYYEKVTNHIYAGKTVSSPPSWWPANFS